VGGGLPDEEAYTIAFGLSAGAAAIASCVAIFITAPFRARRQARPAEALE
jgi:branched-subunit amino acid ABC-type transport system permease component